MFPLKQRKLIRGCAAHINAGLSCGADYVANYVELKAPFDGTLSRFQGTQGGNWSRLIRSSNGDTFEFAHLDRYIKPNGAVKAGEIIAITGNTGQITTGPHLHVQMFRDGVRLDPEKYNWEDAILPPMSCEVEKEEIRKLNTELGKTIQERDSYKEALDASRLKEKEYYDNWQATLDEKNLLRDKIIRIKEILT